MLDDLTVLGPDLRQSFPLKPDNRFDGISRMSAHLHLLYYQVTNPTMLHMLAHTYKKQNVVVVTRPLLFCCVKKIFEDSRDLEPLLTSIIIRQLLDMSLEASQKILGILESLQGQDLLGKNWDTWSEFVHD
jgi:proline utilization trans-activator